MCQLSTTDISKIAVLRSIETEDRPSSNTSKIISEEGNFRIRFLTSGTETENLPSFGKSRFRDYTETEDLPYLTRFGMMIDLRGATVPKINA
ncbi:hypothetical protein AVEN_81923-1 [Araneus ventricosus]|uniref:Uncharacterized protein n=1 Tax=Araneus ventricosus TaxID=182803 RepID=A0A4Y2GKU7_ARAVE|nr:hypothetical protein AVEN_81923-1 [Araneus ventricosus]